MAPHAQPRSASEREAAERLKQLLGDQTWRLNNLYHIKNDAGLKIKFEMNEAQAALWSNLWYLNTVLKARQLGFSTLIAILMLDTCLFNSDISCGIIDITLNDAKKKLEKIKFAYDNLPDWLKQERKLSKENTEEITWSNGSNIQVGTSHRGGTLQYLHVSEFGKIAAQFPEKAREIKTGAFGTVHKGQFIFVESTAEGTGGAFYDMVQDAEKLQQLGRKLSALDFRLHFFPWWRHPDYWLQAGTVVIDAEAEEYFNTLRVKYGIALTEERKAWYIAKRRQIGFDDMPREYPSYPEEAFKTSVEGAYFKRQMSKARELNRIGDVPYDASKPVNTFWDIGVGDSTCIWFHQSDGVRHRLIDYYENSGEGIAHYARVIKERADKNGYVYGKHLGPHDLDNREWTADAKSRLEVAAGLGVKFTVVERVRVKADAIEAARNFLETTWIDEKKCARGIQCLDNYRKGWDEKRATWRDNPVHDWASHGADSLMTGACGFQPERLPKTEDRHRRHTGSSRSSWVA